MKSRRNFLRCGALMAGLAIIMPKELYSVPVQKEIPINLSPLPVVITSNWRNGLAQTITIKNTLDKEQTVMLCQDSLLMNEFIKYHYNDSDDVVYGKHNAGIEFFGVESYLKHIAVNPMVVKDLIVQQDNIKQMKTSLLYMPKPLDQEDCNFLYFPLYNSSDEVPVWLEIIFQNLYLPFNSSTFLRIPMKADCSLSLTFIYEQTN